MKSVNCADALHERKFVLNEVETQFELFSSGQAGSFQCRKWEVILRQCINTNYSLVNIDLTMATCA